MWGAIRRLGAAPQAYVASERVEARKRRDERVGRAGRQRRVIACGAVPRGVREGSEEGRRADSRRVVARGGCGLGKVADAESREGGHGERMLVWTEHRRQPLPPQPHVVLDSPGTRKDARAWFFFFLYQPHVVLDSPEVGGVPAVRHARCA